ncbi:hypothetical protein HMPREF0290_1243 [Corynebacterium efficiens YS-314]|nr:hypothetical protein HMPREF0290_1243 [Corynebacterium efficiens YS-314]
MRLLARSLRFSEDYQSFQPEMIQGFALTISSEMFQGCGLARTPPVVKFLVEVMKKEQ